MRGTWSFGQTPGGVCPWCLAVPDRSYHGWSRFHRYKRNQRLQKLADQKHQEYSCNFVFAGSKQVDLAKFLGFLVGFARPVTGHDIIRHTIFHQVQRNSGKLEGCAALDEQDFVIIRNVHQFAQISFSFVSDGLETLLRWLISITHIPEPR